MQGDVIDQTALLSRMAQLEEMLRKQQIENDELKAQIEAMPAVHSIDQLVERVASVLNRLVCNADGTPATIASQVFVLGQTSKQRARSLKRLTP